VGDRKVPPGAAARDLSDAPAQLLPLRREGAFMSGFIEHVLETMRPWAPVTARRMFGGHGLYRDGLMFALEAFDTLYLKVDAQTEPRFRAARCEPFVYEGKGRPVQMSYWTAPPECVESAGEMARWCALAWQAALRAQTAKAARGGLGRSVAKRAVKKAAKKAAGPTTSAPGSKTTRSKR
jgi:DNA transformation protein